MEDRRRSMRRSMLERRLLLKNKAPWLWVMKSATAAVAVLEQDCSVKRFG